MNTKVKLFLYLSLVVNIVLLGYISGHFFKHNLSPEDKMQHHREAVLSQLPEAKRALASNIFDQLKAKHDLYSAQIDTAKDNVEAELTKDVFDKDAFKKSMAELNDLNGKMKDDAANSIADLAAELTPEERKMVVEQFKKDRPLRK